MRPTTQERLATWMDESRAIGFQHRDWKTVRYLAAVASVFLLTSLPAQYLFGSRELAHASWIVGILVGGAMLVWFYNDRLAVGRILTPTGKQSRDTAA